MTRLHFPVLNVSFWAFWTSDPFLWLTVKQNISVKGMWSCAFSKVKKHWCNKNDAFHTHTHTHTHTDTQSTPPALLKIFFFNLMENNSVLVPLPIWVDSDSNNNTVWTPRTNANVETSCFECVWYLTQRTIALESEEGSFPKLGFYQPGGPSCR